MFINNRPHPHRGLPQKLEGRPPAGVGPAEAESGHTCVSRALCLGRCVAGQVPHPAATWRGGQSAGPGGRPQDRGVLGPVRVLAVRPAPGVGPVESDQTLAQFWLRKRAGPRFKREENVDLESHRPEGVSSRNGLRTQVTEGQRALGAEERVEVPPGGGEEGDRRAQLRGGKPAGSSILSAFKGRF